MSIYRKLQRVDTSIIREYRDIINYLAEKKYRKCSLLENLLNDINCNNIDNEKRNYYYVILKNILNDILEICKKLNCEQDEEYQSFKSNFKILTNIFQPNGRVNDDSIWKVLNENVYNIEDKLTSIVTMLKLSNGDFSIENRIIHGNKANAYSFRYTCSLKFCGRIIFRLYYEPIENTKTIKLFNGIKGLYNLPKNQITINSEEHLDELLQLYMERII